MSIVKRLAQSLRATRSQFPEPLLRSAATERWSVPELTLPEAQAELYQRLAPVSVAVSTVANLGATAALNVVREAGEKMVDVPNHDFERLIRRPNPADSRSELIVGTLSYLSLTGNAYWYMNRPSATDKPLELWLIPSWNVRPVPDGRSYLAGYEYDPGDGHTLLLDTWQICHFKRFHPRNRWVGMSLVEALATDAQADLAMGQWNKNYFAKDNAKVPGALAFSDFVQDGQWEKIKADAKAGWGGTNRSGPMMLRGAGAGGVEWVAMALSQAEMEFLAGRQYIKEEIYAGFAPGLASMLAINANEANARVGKGILIEFAVWPLLVAVAEKITNDILPAYGDAFVAEFEDIRVTDQAMELQKQDAFARVHTIDEIRSEYYDEKPLGDPRGDLLPAQVAATTPGPGMEELEPEPEPVPAGLLAAGPVPEQPEQAPEPEPAESDGDDEIGAATKAEMDKYRRKSLKALKAGKPADVKFSSDVLSPGMAGAISGALESAQSIEDVNAVFDSVWLGYP